MKVKVRVTFKEYVRLLYGLTYRKPIMIFLLCVAGAMVMWIIGFYGNILPVPKPAYYQYLTLILIAVIQPLVIYNTIRRNYYSSNPLKEKLEIEFTDEEIKMQGDSFYMELTWRKTYKVVELKHWFLIYQNNLSAIIIPKKSFKVREVKELKVLLQSIKGIDLHLMKEA